MCVSLGGGKGTKLCLRQDGKSGGATLWAHWKDGGEDHRENSADDEGNGCGLTDREGTKLGYCSGSLWLTHIGSKVQHIRWLYATQ